MFPAGSDPRFVILTEEFFEMCSHCHDEAIDVKRSAIQVYNLQKHVIVDQVRVLNEVSDGSGAKIFKAYENRMDRDIYVESDADEELLFHIPFDSVLNVQGFTLIGDEDESHPAAVKVFKNSPQMTFDDTKRKADQEFSLKQDTQGEIDYPLRAVKFSSCHSLTLFFYKNFGGPRTRIYYIGLRGEFVSKIRDEAVIAIYEATPQMQDHKNTIPQFQSHSVC